MQMRYVQTSTVPLVLAFLIASNKARRMGWLCGQVTLVGEEIESISATKVRKEMGLIGPFSFSSWYGYF